MIKKKPSAKTGGFFERQKNIFITNNIFKSLQLTISILLLFLSICLFSCDKVKRKSHNIINEAQGKIDDTKDKLKEKKDSLIDKVFPSYDSDTSDTESNKKRFREHLEVNISADVKNIYAHGDFLGIDYKVLIAFTCDKATIFAHVGVPNG